MVVVAVALVLLLLVLGNQSGGIQQRARATAAVAVSGRCHNNGHGMLRACVPRQQALSVFGIRRQHIERIVVFVFASKRRRRGGGGGQQNVHAGIDGLFLRLGVIVLVLQDQPL